MESCPNWGGLDACASEAQPRDMERIRPVETPPDDVDRPAKPERFSPYAVPLSTLMGGAMIATAEQTAVHPDPGDYPMSVPIGPEGVAGADDG